MASLGREGDRINHTFQFENILLSTLLKVGIVLKRYGGVVDTQMAEELKAIVAQAEQSASEV